MYIIFNSSCRHCRQFSSNIIWRKKIWSSLWMKSVAPHQLAFYLDLHFLKRWHRILRKKNICAQYAYTAAIFLNARSHIFQITYLNIPGRLQSKTLILSTIVDQKSLETDILIAICRRQLKTLFLGSFDPRPLIAKSIFDCGLPDVLKH